MSKKEIDIKFCAEYLNGIISGYKTLKEFSRAIEEDSADIFRWRTGRRIINPRAVITIARLHPEVEPHLLNPFVFPSDLTLKFGD